MFGRKQEEPARVQAERVEGPYVVDNWDFPQFGDRDPEALQDLMNARYQEGYELVWIYPVMGGYATLVWKKER
jgi:hypothetical protein